MKILYLDCGMGAAGDMLEGALVSLLSKEEQESFISKINSIGIKDTTVTLRDDLKCGITCSHIDVKIHGEEEHSHDVHEMDGRMGEKNHSHLEHGHSHCADNHYDGYTHSEHSHVHDEEGYSESHDLNADHHHEHHDCHADYHHEHVHDSHDDDHNHGVCEEHDHHHSHAGDSHHHHHDHHHAAMADIEKIIDSLEVSEKVKKDVKAVYRIVAEAEAKVHGKDVTMVHFHEVGMMDAVADITGVAMLMELLEFDRVVCSPVNTGFGKVRCAHGILPVPAPATAEILSGIPVYAGRFEGEMCTPTGAALLKYYADEYSNMPLMTIDRTGYGSGNKDFEAANVLKAVLGSTYENGQTKSREEECTGNLTSGEQIIELRCNVDDMTGEDMSYAVEKLFEAGARDAFVTPVIMKKGRSGMLLTVLCDSDISEKIAECIFKHTTTIGIRECVMSRIILKRKEETVHTQYGDVRVKISEGYGVRRVKPEFEDIKILAQKNSKSAAEIRTEIDRIINRQDT